MWRSCLKIGVFLVILNLLFVGTTDADMIVSRDISQNELAATTLDFSSRDTANGSNTNTLFNTAGMRPGGFQIKAIRVQKDGVMNFDYKIRAEISESGQPLCDALSVTILENWQQKFKGKLGDLQLERKMEESGLNDWVIVVDLDSDEAGIKSSSCNFDFIFETNNQGFNNTERVENQVSSGMW